MHSCTVQSVATLATHFPIAWERCRFCRSGIAGLEETSMLRIVRGLLLGTLIALLMVPGLPASAQDRDYDEGVFYEELAPYGEWSDHPRWGAVWRPRVSDDWRPYSRGHWAYTEEHGWYWMAEEPFGWAVFHYGRWVLDEYGGWIWIPGNEWGPAWVAWRYSDEYVGWAPLPPDTSWGPDGQLLYDERFYDEPRYASAAWCFVRPGYLMTPGLYSFLVPRPQNYVILRRTQHVYGYRRLDRRVFNSGYDLRRFERHLGRPVPLMRVRAVDSPREHGLGRGPGGPDIPVFRPRIIDRPGGAPARPPFVVSPDRRPPSAGIPPGDGRPRFRQPGPDSAPPGSPPGVMVPPHQPRALTPPPPPGGGPMPPAARAPGPPPAAAKGPPPARPVPKKDDKKGHGEPK
jgi:hypothetical protein